MKSDRHLIHSMFTRSIVSRRGLFFLTVCTKSDLRNDSNLQYFCSSKDWNNEFVLINSLMGALVFEQFFSVISVTLEKF